MALIPWRRERRGGLLDLQNRINGMFEDLFRGSWLTPWAEEQVQWLPTLNVSESDEAVRVTAELPGVNPKEVDISISDDLLTMRGEKKAEKEESDSDYHRIERSYGAFSRTVRLPAVIDADKVEATFKDGILTINLPKREEAKTRRVKVEIK